MVLDTSAAVAIALGEPERSQFLQQVIEADKVLISAATFIEIAIVLENRVGPAATREMETFLRSLGAEIVSVDSVQAEQAQLAYRRYGKGRHPAALNFGDCLLMRWPLSLASLSSQRGKNSAGQACRFVNLDIDFPHHGKPPSNAREMQGEITGALLTFTRGGL